MKLPSISVMAASLLFAAGASGANPTNGINRHAPVKPEVDLDKVMRVEAAAQRKGVRVYWVHPPRFDANRQQKSERTYRFKSKRQSKG